MANYYAPPQQAPQQGNLQFFDSGGYTQQGYGDYSAAAPQYGQPAGSMGAMGTGGGGLRTGLLAAFSTEGYEGEPPLLEELGVNFGHIQAKTLAVLNPLGRVNQHLMDDSDLAGPILFFVLFGTFLLFSGKVHFGYIYGLALLGSVSLHFILSMMAPVETTATTTYAGTPGYDQAPDPTLQGTSTLTFARSASVLGYCLLPLVATSLIGVAIPMDGTPGIVLTTVAIAWCTFSASNMFCAVGRMQGMYGLVAYPLALFYVGFGIMSIFSSRDSGSLGNVVNTP